jgi:hypothetical protein
LILLFHEFAEVAAHNPAMLETVLNGCRCKFIGGGLTNSNLDVLTSELFTSEWHPHIIRDEITALEVEPVETQREQPSATTTRSQGYGLSLPQTVAVGASASESEGKIESTTQSSQHTSAVGLGLGESHATARSTVEAVTEAEHWADAKSEGKSWMDGLGESSGMGQNQSYDYPYGALGALMPTAMHTTSGDHSGLTLSHADGGSMAVSHMHGGTTARSLAQGTSEAHGTHRQLMSSASDSTGIAETTGTTTNSTETQSLTVSLGLTPSWRQEESHGESVTIIPFHELRKRWRVASREFLSLADFLTTKLIKLKSQARAFWAVQGPGDRTVFFKAVFVHPLPGGRERLAAFRQRVFGQPCYQRDALPEPPRTVTAPGPALVPEVLPPAHDTEPDVEPQFWQPYKP